jgi:membrane-associated phospholipid phosphatase
VIERTIHRVFGSGRSLGVTEFLQAEASWPIVVLFALISQLGDVWFLFLLGGVFYVAGEYTPRWVLDRRRGLTVLALLLTYLSLVGVLKDVFRLARPPGATTPPGLEAVPLALQGVFTSITTASGPGFPSGHALGTTMVWGGVALLLDRGRFRSRAALVAGIVAAVSASRLVIGVHYFVDVVVGAAVGLVVLVATYRLSANGAEPGRILGVAVAVGLLGLVRTVGFDSVAALGGAVGGWVVWHWLAEEVKPQPSDPWAVVVGFAVLGVAGVVFGVVYALETPLWVTFLGAGTTVGVAVGAPLVGDRVV